MTGQTHSTDLREVDAHFEFGANWSRFARVVDDERVRDSEYALARLLGTESLRGRSFLDIGCGSGLSALAALRMGAERVACVDIDPLSVETTRELLSDRVPEGRWSAERASVFELDAETHGRFDVVYSWGVLHHTGDMRGAIRRAARLVSPDGRFALALYRRTPCCGLWRAEKRIYTRSSEPVRALLRGVYRAAFSAALLARMRSPQRYAREYRHKRGMSWAHDIHDWLGGYPYESISEADLRSLADELGFEVERCFARQSPLGGLLGSGCDEYLLARR